jgi:alkanesulfonate monooxygenase SsuD/methylene tetrahydromethanopterin reductase-like flavin-dependent oxidoreductase (luciferase family)
MVAMRIVAVLSPVADWRAIVEAAQLADAAGLDGIGLWDNYHSAQPDWGYIAGWSAYGSLAAATSRVRLVPMVLNTPHFQPGVIAKESSTLAIASGGRFELGLGAGDWPSSFAAWGQPFPSAPRRLEALVELAEVLRLLWAGQPVTFEGEHIRLHEAICTPTPTTAPEIVIGAGGSRSAIACAVPFADEINVYGDAELVDAVRAASATTGRSPRISVFLDWSYDNWPADPQRELDHWAARGIGRVAVSIGSPEMPERIRILATCSTPDGSAPA